MLSKFFFFINELILIKNRTIVNSFLWYVTIICCTLRCPCSFLFSLLHFYVKAHTQTIRHIISNHTTNIFSPFFFETKVTQPCMGSMFILAIQPAPANHTTQKSHSLHTQLQKYQTDKFMAIACKTHVQIYHHGVQSKIYDTRRTYE